MRTLGLDRTAMAMAAVSFGLAFGSSYASGQEEGCKHDMQCKGDRICEKNVCVSPRVGDLFPGSSTPSPLVNRRIIKTTRTDCDQRRGQHRPIDDPKAGDMVRCVLPAGD
jgi:hypothetical protein